MTLNRTRSSESPRLTAGTLAAGLLLIAGVASAGLLLIAAVATAAPPAPAYMIAEFQLEDAEAIKPYRDTVEATFKPYGGRFLVRGGAKETKEGDPVRGHIVVTRFDSMALAQAWYASPAYQEILPIRINAGESRVYFVEGLTE